MNRLSHPAGGIGGSTLLKFFVVVVIIGLLPKVMPSRQTGAKHDFDLVSYGRDGKPGGHHQLAMRFLLKAVNPKQDVITLELEAADKSAARDAARRQGLIVLAIRGPGLARLNM